MKRLLLTALFAGGAAMAANAQAGSILGYGNLGIATSKDAAGNKSLSFNINPGIGYQMNNHWTLGLEGGFGSTRYKEDGATSTDFTNQYNVGAFGRFTQPLGHQHIFAFIGQLGAGYMGTTQGNTTSGSVSAVTNGGYAYFVPAIAVYVHKGLALNFAFGGAEFNTQKLDGASGSLTSFDMTFGQQFSIGISKNFLCGSHKRHHVGTNHGSRHDYREDMEESEESED